MTVATRPGFTHLLLAWSGLITAEKSSKIKLISSAVAGVESVDQVESSVGGPLCYYKYIEN